MKCFAFLNVTAQRFGLFGLFGLFDCLVILAASVFRQEQPQQQHLPASATSLQIPSHSATFIDIVIVIIISFCVALKASYVELIDMFGSSCHTDFNKHFRD